MRHGFVKIAAAIPKVKVADCGFNSTMINSVLSEAVKQGIEIICFPELSITAYTCGDLFLQNTLLKGAEEGLASILLNKNSYGPLCFVGMPVKKGNSLYNAAVAIQNDKILGVVPKTNIPNYGEFYEKRWFVPGCPAEPVSEIMLCGQTVPFGTDILFSCGEVCVGTEICEDLWMPVPPSSRQVLAGANILVNLSASNDIAGKYSYIRELVKQQSARCVSAYVYTSAGMGESTTDLVFAGKSVISENGIILNEAKKFYNDNQITVSEVDIEKIMFDRRKNTGFSTPVTGIVSASAYTSAPASAFVHIPFERGELSSIPPEITVNPRPFVPSLEDMDNRCSEIFHIQAAGLRKRLEHTGTKTAVIGISGGLDSTLALLVCIEAFKMQNLPLQGIIAVTMPGFGTTGRTYNNAVGLIKELKVSLREISIKEACLQHFKDIWHNPEIHDVTYENSQARERTQILMDIANMENALVIGTGDLSELALGWATYNGDHMSMYGVNAGVPKTLVRYLIQWQISGMSGNVRNILEDILNTPVSPELLPADKSGTITQKTEDIVGPYDLHDFFLFYVLRYGFGPSKIYFLACNAFTNEFTGKEILKWMNIFFRRFFSQQFKRSCMPDGPKVGSVNLSPRGDWRMPSDAVSALWLNELEKLG